jgi:hypothetical protein
MLIARKRKRVAIAIGLAMTASGRKNGTDAKNARSRNLSFGYGSSKCENNLGITGGADVAHGSEPAPSVTAAW